MKGKRRGQVGKEGRPTAQGQSQNSLEVARVCWPGHWWPPRCPGPPSGRRLSFLSWGNCWLLVKARDRSPPQKLPLERGCCLAQGRAPREGSPYLEAGPCRAARAWPLAWIPPPWGAILAPSALWGLLQPHLSTPPTSGLHGGCFPGSVWSPLPATLRAPGQSLTHLPP